MPNHVWNTLTIKAGKKLTDEIKKFVKGTKKAGNKVTEEVAFCADSILPMPDCLHGVTCPVHIVTETERNKEIVERQKSIEANPDMANWDMGHSITKEMQKEYMERYGFDNWYDWAIKNWGTKWGVYDVTEWKGNKISFNTAWSPPIPIIEALS